MYLHRVISGLPFFHYDALKQLVGLFNLLFQNTLINKLNSEELAKAFGPILLRPKLEEFWMLEDQSKVIKVVKTIIDNHDFLFKVNIACRNSFSNVLGGRYSSKLMIVTEEKRKIFRMVLQLNIDFLISTNLENNRFIYI
jgi:hypothetical protein